MIDFENPSFLKLRPVQDSKLERLVQPMLIAGDEIVQTFQGMRDGVVFTDRRVIAVNVQGLTGMKKAFTVLPYSRVQAFAVESAGLGDLDGELQLWFSGGLGAVKFELLAGSDLALLSRVIGSAISG